MNKTFTEQLELTRTRLTVEWRSQGVNIGKSDYRLLNGCVTRLQLCICASRTGLASQPPIKFHRLDGWMELLTTARQSPKRGWKIIIRAQILMQQKPAKYATNNMQICK